jgi:hypothetical protein
MRNIIAIALLLSLPQVATAQDNEDDFDPMTVDVVDAINCYIDARTYNIFAITIDGSDQYWKKRRWKKLKSKNFMMAEFQLPAPVEITAGYRTNRIAFTSSGILAILDIADPKLIAGPEKIENQMDSTAMIDELVKQGVATREEIEKELKFRKFLGERVIVDEKEIDKDLNMAFHTKITRNISNTTTHPGKTLYGCSYRIEFEDLPEKK